MLNFDGSSNNNAKEKGSRWIIINLKGKTKMKYVWGIGKLTNNLAKAYGLLEVDKKIVKLWW